MRSARPSIWRPFACVVAIDGRKTSIAVTGELDLSTSRELEASVKEARAALDTVRAAVSELDVARATAEADLSHLAHPCEDAVNATLEQVLVEVDELEQQGQAVPQASAIEALDGGDEAEEGSVISHQSSLARYLLLTM